MRNILLVDWKFNGKKIFKDVNEFQKQIQRIFAKGIMNFIIQKSFNPKNTKYRSYCYTSIEEDEKDWLF